MNLKSIPSRDISVVIQGPLHRGKPEGLERCLASIRTHLPEAEIIISTAETEDVTGLDSDVVVVVTPDPGCIEDVNGSRYNLNRQVRTTASGLARASRPYALKFRADHALEGSRICSLPAGASADGPGPITLTSLFVRNPEKYPVIYHASDVVMFGRTGDMREFWDDTLFEDGEVCFGEPSHPPFGSCWSYSRIRLVPEQALTLRWLRRRGEVCDLGHPSDIDEAQLQHWGQCLVRHFTLLDWQTSGVSFPLRFSTNRYNHTVMTEADFARVALEGFNNRKRRLNQYFGQYLTLRNAYALLSGVMLKHTPGLHRAMKNARDACGPLKRYMKARLA